MYGLRGNMRNVVLLLLITTCEATPEVEKIEVEGVDPQKIGCDDVGDLGIVPDNRKSLLYIFTPDDTNLTALLEPFYDGPTLGTGYKFITDTKQLMKASIVLIGVALLIVFLGCCGWQACCRCCRCCSRERGPSTSRTRCVVLCSVILILAGIVTTCIFGSFATTEGTQAFEVMACKSTDLLSLTLNGTADSKEDPTSGFIGLNPAKTMLEGVQTQVNAFRGLLSDAVLLPESTCVEAVKGIQTEYGFVPNANTGKMGEDIDNLETFSNLLASVSAAYSSIASYVLVCAMSLIFLAILLWFLNINGVLLFNSREVRRNVEEEIRPQNPYSKTLPYATCHLWCCNCVLAILTILVGGSLFYLSEIPTSICLKLDDGQFDDVVDAFTRDSDDEISSMTKSLWNTCIADSCPSLTEVNCTEDVKCSWDKETTPPSCKGKRSFFGRYVCSADSGPDCTLQKFLENVKVSPEILGKLDMLPEDCEVPGNKLSDVAKTVNQAADDAIAKLKSTTTSCADMEPLTKDIVRNACYGVVYNIVYLIICYLASGALVLVSSILMFLLYRLVTDNFVEWVELDDSLEREATEDSVQTHQKNRIVKRVDTFAL